MADNPTAAPQGDGAPQGVGFSIERIYIKDLSLENPGAPQSFQLTEPPQVEVGMRTRGEQIAPDVYEFVLTLTVTATIGGKTLFLVETSQAGVFTIRGVPPDQLQPVMAINCPNVLFPYARETIADATMRAGFPPVHLAPINFEALYQQQLSQQQVPAVTN
jgi:preprotein translocase subunit SecB